MTLLSQNMSITEIEKTLNEEVEANWERILEDNHVEFETLFPEYEDATYGMYAEKLLGPIWRQVEDSGFYSAAEVKADDFVIAGFLLFRQSLEKEQWGTPANEKRVFWLTIKNSQHKEIGTLLMEMSHSHVRFSIPAPPKFFALQTTNGREIRSQIRSIYDK
ncbi:DUF6022 family protein [Alkalihalophilus pseudofirmus]|uniref:DUF6022 family protein n=1 Tax=Alkalihalophilus pseudofirmus TaxID=79885 RepID=UPI00259BF29F|nr:DUF6022 family protein [Alkalihalophilus pseudofirmus]WEG17339.1 DUF6022 family protein [Alkalihalophilus pseudofirmus]